MKIIEKLKKLFKIKTKPIFVIITVRVPKNNKGWQDISERAVGWYKKFETAEKVVLGNYCDIAELGYYKYATIEKTDEGLYPISECKKSSWYVYDEEKKTYVPCEMPELFKTTCSMGIG